MMDGRRFVLRFGLAAFGAILVVACAAPDTVDVPLLTRHDLPGDDWAEQQSDLSAYSGEGCSLLAIVKNTFMEQSGSRVEFVDARQETSLWELVASFQESEQAQVRMAALRAAVSGCRTWRELAPNGRTYEWTYSEHDALVTIGNESFAVRAVGEAAGGPTLGVLATFVRVEEKLVVLIYSGLAASHSVSLAEYEKLTRIVAGRLIE